MKRFWLFAGDAYECGGGMKDFIESFDTVDDAIKHLVDGGSDWAHVLDTQENVIAAKRECNESWYVASCPIELL